MNIECSVEVLDELTTTFVLRCCVGNMAQTEGCRHRYLPIKVLSRQDRDRSERRRDRDEQPEDADVETAEAGDVDDVVDAEEATEE